MSSSNRYSKIIAEIFHTKYQDNVEQVPFERDDLIKVAEKLKIKLPKNLGDVIYSFRYRYPLPQSVREKAPEGKEWIIRPAGSGKYCFVATSQALIEPNSMMAETKIPDATPGIIAKYALSDEQALLAILRYNRLIDIFTGVACYSLQSHLRTTVSQMGQIETDEVYVGVDKKGIHYVFPVQAKGGNDQLSVVQIEQDIAMCAAKFPSLLHRAIAAQFMDDSLIALFELEQSEHEIRIVSEKHYRLVPKDDLTDEDLRIYQQRQT